MMPTATSKQVLEYYSRNFQTILRCYDIGADGLPVDPAYYRRLIYQRILEDTQANRILDVGCGGGRTVLDALERGRKVKGIEPVTMLVDNARALLKERGYEPDVIVQEDMTNLRGWEARAVGTVSALSVLPHVEESCWDEMHGLLARLIEPGGYFIASYRNDLFDLYTFNSFTVDFFMNVLLSENGDVGVGQDTIQARIESLITNPQVPEKSFTMAKDKSFGSLTRVNSNPLVVGRYLEKFGLKQEKVYFYNYHCVPPLIAESIPNYRKVSHELNIKLPEDWRGVFMASTFVVLARREVRSD